MVRKKVTDIKTMFKKLQNNRDEAIKGRFTKYVVDYAIEGDRVRVISNTGKSRLVKKTHTNLNKINHAIIKNKIDIANKIDNYEDTNKERLIVLLFNIMFLCVAGVFIPFSFFTGKIFFFLLAVLLFAMTVIATSVIAIDYYILALEIQNLKRITGYKKENEFKLPEFNLSKVKSH